MRMFLKAAAGLTSAGVFLLAAAAHHGERPPGDALPAMKFNDVREVAPGVFFRYSSISATDPSVPFGGCNNIWVVFKDYVAVIDANFPKEAGDVIEAVKKTTDKPIRYVLDTHHHGDHAYGNAVWAKAGATILGQANCARLLKVSGPKQWADAALTRKDIATSELKAVDVPFDDQYVLDDGNRRVEFRYLGHAHTPGDAVAYLPKDKILCTGDACVNGAFNFMGHSNSASWVRCLEKMEQFDVTLVCPGHGPPAGKDVLALQRRYFQDLRAAVQKGIDAGKSLAEITAGLDLAWYKEWTGKAAKANKDNVEHVFKELTGRIEHDRLGRRIDAPLSWPAAEPPVRAVQADRRGD
jgi:glyoxylase-like metal-dependent hydrolase (beta-lactamase superfamily II)